MYNGFPASDVTSVGARRNSIEAAFDGIVGRGRPPRPPPPPRRRVARARRGHRARRARRRVSEAQGVTLERGRHRPHLDRAGRPPGASTGHGTRTSSAWPASTPSASRGSPSARPLGARQRRRVRRAPGQRPPRGRCRCTCACSSAWACTCSTTCSSAGSAAACAAAGALGVPASSSRRSRSAAAPARPSTRSRSCDRGRQQHDLRPVQRAPAARTRSRSTTCSPGALEQAVLADQLGYGCWWSVEHHCTPGFSYSGAPELDEHGHRHAHRAPARSATPACSRRSRSTTPAGRRAGCRARPPLRWTGRGRPGPIGRRRVGHLRRGSRGDARRARGGSSAHGHRVDRAGVQLDLGAPGHPDPHARAQAGAAAPSGALADGVDARAARGWPASSAWGSSARPCCRRSRRSRR